MRRLLPFSEAVSSDGIEPGLTIRWNLGLHPVLATRAGEPEPERGAMEPANFRGAGAGAGAFLNISADPELEP